MGALDDIKARFPDGLPVEIGSDELAEKVKDAADRLDTETLKDDLKALDDAIRAQDKLAAAVRIAKMATSLGLQFV